MTSAGASRRRRWQLVGRALRIRASSSPSPTPVAGPRHPRSQRSSGPAPCARGVRQTPPSPRTTWRTGLTTTTDPEIGLALGLGGLGVALVALTTNSIWLAPRRHWPRTRRQAQAAQRVQERIQSTGRRGQGPKPQRRKPSESVGCQTSGTGRSRWSSFTGTVTSSPPKSACRYRSMAHTASSAVPCRSQGDVRSPRGALRCEES